MQTAVVTGAGGGLGRCIAEGLVEKGFHVVLTDIDGEAARQSAESIGANTSWLAQDVRDAASHRRVAELAQSHGPLTLWVNNAGILRVGSSDGLSEADVDDQVDINLKGVIWGSRAAVDAMRESGQGLVINIASIAAFMLSPSLSVYCGTKHAVLGYSLSLQGDLKNEGLGIRVSVFCPGPIDTGMVHEVQHDRHADLLFVSGKPQSPQNAAKHVLAQVHKPKLVVTYPWHRNLLFQIFRIFPGFGLRFLNWFQRKGARFRAQEIGRV